jgi:hypothetical protein
MNPMVKKAVAFSLIGLGGADLMLGNTDKQILPAFVANELSQQADAVLIGLGIVILVFF